MQKAQVNYVLLSEIVLRPTVTSLCLLLWQLEYFIITCAFSCVLIISNNILTITASPGTGSDRLQWKWCHYIDMHMLKNTHHCDTVCLAQFKSYRLMSGVYFKVYTVQFCKSVMESSFHAANYFFGGFSTDVVLSYSCAT